MNGMKARIEAERALDVPGETCDVSCAPCVCPTCGVTEKLLRVALRRAGTPVDDLDRIHVSGADFRGGAYPYKASVRVDGREVYRIHDRPDEVFDPEVIADVVSALERRGE